MPNPQQPGRHSQRPDNPTHLALHGVASAGGFGADQGSLIFMPYLKLSVASVESCGMSIHKRKNPVGGMFVTGRHTPLFVGIRPRRAHYVCRSRIPHIVSPADVRAAEDAVALYKLIETLDLKVGSIS